MLFSAALVLTSIGSRAPLHAQAPAAAQYGTQYTRNVTHASTFQSATIDGGVLAGNSAAEAANFRPYQFAEVYIPCAVVSPEVQVIAHCFDPATRTEVAVQVVLESVSSAGELTWSSVSEDWPTLPAAPSRIESILFFPVGTSVDAAGRSYIADSWNHRIAVFDATGTPLYTIGTFGAVYTLDADGYPDPNGACYKSIGGGLVEDTTDPSPCTNDPTQQLGQFNGPQDVSVSPDGSLIVVADSGNNRIQILHRNPGALPTAATTVAASNGDLYTAASIGSWGLDTDTYSPTVGEMEWPAGVAYEASTGRIVIADTDNSRILVYDRSNTGSVVASDNTKYSGFTFGHIGDTVPGHLEEFNYPLDVAIGPDRRIVVVDSGNNQIKVYTGDGQGVVVLGADPGPALGRFNYPSGADVRANGDLLVADTDLGRLQLLKRVGDGYEVDTTTQFESVSSPFGVAFTPDQGMLIVEGSGHDITKLAPLGLQVTSVSGPAPASIVAGGQSAITFTVQNTGGTLLSDVTPEIDGGATLVACTLDGVSADDAAAADIAAGASHTFTVCVTSADAGHTLNLHVAAVGGTGSLSYEAAPAPVQPLDILADTGARMGVSATAPSPASAGSPFTVTVTVKNQGSVPLTGVTLALTGGAQAQFVPAESDATSVAQIPVGGEQIFHLKYLAVSPGTFGLSVTVTTEQTSQDTNEPVVGTAAVSVVIQDDTLPPQFLSFDVRGPNGLGPNAYGWIQDEFQQGATVTAVVADQGSSGLASIRYSIQGSSGGGILLNGEATKTYTSGPITSRGQGRMLIAFWAEDKAGNSARLDLVPRRLPTGGSEDNSSFCARVPSQCLYVNVDPLYPVLLQQGITISADRTEARIAFNASDTQSDVAQVFLTAGVPENTSARLDFEAGSNSRGTLVLTTKGPEVWGKVTVVDFAGFSRSFQLPFPGPDKPALRLDDTPPEAFNRLDPAALGATCAKTGTGNVVLFTYFCTNKVYGTDNLPGLTTNAFAPVSVVPIMWGNGDNAVGDPKFDGIAELHTYSFTDEYVPATGPAPIQSPNRVTLVEKVRQQGQEARVHVISYQYNDGPVHTPDWAYKKYEWANSTRGGAIKTLNQKFELWRGNDREQVLANWDLKTNKTTIRELGPHPERRVVADGLILLKMTTWQGTLKIEYDVNSPVPPPSAPPVH